MNNIDYSTFWFLLGKLMLKLKLKPLAFAAIKKSISMDVNHKTQYEKYYLLGNAYTNAGLFVEACSAYESALEINSSYAKLHFIYGYAKAKINDWSSASKAYKIATEINPGQSEWHYHLGYARFKNQNWEGAAEALKVAVELDSRWAGWYVKLGVALEKLERWEEASEVYDDAQKLDDGTYERSIYLGLWKSLYRTGKEKEALQNVLDYLSNQPNMLSDKKELVAITKILKKFDNVRDNYDFVTGALNAHIDSRQTASLAVMSWMLAIPSAVSRLLPKIDSDLVTASLQNKLKAVSISIDFNLSCGNKSHNRVMVVLDHNTDYRVLYDVCKMYNNVAILASAKMTTYINNISHFFSSVDIMTIGTNLQKNSRTERDIAEDSDSISEVITNNLKDIFTNNALKGLFARNAPAFQLALDDTIYHNLYYSASCALFAKEYEPGRIVLVSNNKARANLLSNIYKSEFPKIKLSTYYSFSDELSFSEQGCDAGEQSFCKASLAQWHYIEELVAKFVDKKRLSLINSADEAVAVVFHRPPDNFRIKHTGRSIIKCILKRANCIIIFACKIKPIELNHFIDEMNFLSENNKERFYAHVYECFFDKFEEDKLVLERIIWQLFHKLKLGFNKNREDFLTKSNYFNQIILSSAMNQFLKNDFFHILASCAQAEATFENSRVQSILFVGGDRTASSRAISQAASINNICRFSYIDLLHTDHPRYKKQLSEYVILQDHYNANFFINHFKNTSEQILIAGSHLAQNIINVSKNIDMQKARETLGINNKKKVILFATQPDRELVCSALYSLIEATRELSVLIVVRLHPNDQYIHAYRSIIDQSHAFDSVIINQDNSLQELIIASNMVITFFSNVGIEAAVLDRHVLSVQLGEEPFPVDLADMGVAISAKSREELYDMVRELLEGGPAAQLCKARRDKYFAINPEMITGSAAERIADFVSPASGGSEQRLGHISTC